MLALPSSNPNAELTEKESQTGESEDVGKCDATSKSEKAPHDSGSYVLLSLCCQTFVLLVADLAMHANRG